MRYDTLLFDADDTLLDFRAAERDALFRLFAAHGLQMTDELHTAYSGYNQSLWRRLERGELTREQLLQTRFSGFFAQIGAKAGRLVGGGRIQGIFGGERVADPRRKRGMHRTG